MSSIRSDVLTTRHPEWKAAVESLSEIMLPGKEYPFAYLVERMSSISPQTLSMILTELSSIGILRRTVRVESPVTGGGIRDFPSLADVPEEIRDWRTGDLIAVKPANVVPIFALPNEASC